MTGVATEPAAQSTLALGTGVRLLGDTRRAGGGELLVGGSPTRILRLGERARALLGSGELTVTDAATSVLATLLLDASMAALERSALGGVHTARSITVVVPVRDRAAQLEACLDALTGACVVVVDDGSLSPDQVAAVCRRHGAELVRHEENAGPAAARNSGLRRVRTELVAFVDSDVRADLAALLRLARHCEDERVALVAPRVVGRVSSTRPRWFERHEAGSGSLDRGVRPCTVRPGAQVGWVPSACLLGRVALLGNGFDETMRVGEDVDLVWRLAERGGVVRYDPSVVVEHDVRSSARAWLGRQVEYGRSGALLARRHGGSVAPAVLRPVEAVAATAHLVRSCWSGPALLLAWTIGAARARTALPQVSGRTALAGRLAAEAQAGALAQVVDLGLKHWWPLTVAACTVSPVARRATVTALVLEVLRSAYRRPTAGPASWVLGRRLEDAAYGWGCGPGRSRLVVPER